MIKKQANKQKKHANLSWMFCFYKESLHSQFEKITVPGSPVGGLNIILSMKLVQCGLGDVDSAEKKDKLWELTPFVANITSCIPCLSRILQCIFHYD